MVFMAMPSTLSSSIEEWYVDQVVAMTKRRNVADGGSLPRKFDSQPPDEFLKELDKFMEDNGHKSSLQLRIQKPRSPRPLRQQEMAWFLPTVMNHVEKYQRKGSKEWTGHSELDGYSVCFDNRSDNQVHMIFDIILVSDDLTDDEETDGGVGINKKHLTPLEEELATSVSAAVSIINEMRYLESREARMRVTTESINTRIRFFSYLSVAVLLTVTYLQVTYLKRYFKKKKLM
jgi:p24 family protein delta-1